MFQRGQSAKGAWRSPRPYSMRKLGDQSPKKTVLVVDDDELVLRTVRRILRDEWEIHTARSAVEAVDILEKKDFDAVLTDYEMPGENGIWLLEEVKRSNPRTSRVLSSGNGPVALQEYLMSGLVVCFVSKPTNRTNLISALNTSIENAQSA